ncbi:hypothetical protein M431DRAFT_373318 [Trichoderma harzianum CBS 226.95]|uniref:Uncharacterized protein n=1 Tax=Trichoderma harzianum CBS 226.95 TaxID=983964 RepID=A0A2T4AH26_TRIHA|nr:hypothetical protein M431DRAFT_373318 [Trichoderma harzianum CBS 226.95]PTB56333.1 hypothetical protein M431DRAFT_373318 [Trichoderma harzianum CBS 226.95]
MPSVLCLSHPTRCRWLAAVQLDSLYMNATCNFQCISRHTAVLYGRHMQMGLDWTGLIHSSIRSTTDVAPIDTCRLATTISAGHCPRLNSTGFDSTRTLIDKLLRLHAAQLLTIPVVCVNMSY